MARIRKEDHQRILHMVDVEHRKVPDIAAEFGCTPANIYALVGKLRRQSIEAESRGAHNRGAHNRGAHTRGAHTQAPLALADDPPSTQVPAAAASPNVVVFERVEAIQEPPAVSPPPPVFAPAAITPPPVATAQPARRSARGAPAIRLAKQGYGLVMRTSDGEENVAPFRSLDDLLSAVKPILRATATSAEPVWFSLQPIDLATLDMDAA